jgi:branched-chain amino acid transport system permease protein
MDSTNANSVSQNTPAVLRWIAIIVILAGLLSLPYGLEYQHQDLLIFLVINFLVVVSYRLMTLTGEWSLIHLVIVGVGAYSSAMLTKFLGLSFWIALPIGGLGGATIAAMLCYPLFRTSQFYFLIGSFAAGESIRLLWIYDIGTFGGTSGIHGLPLPELFGIDFGEAVNYYYLALVIVSICLALLYRLEKSRVGLTLHAIHWQPKLAESVGVNAWGYRSIAFIVASFFAGIAGVLKVHYLGNLNPHQFDITPMVFVLIWVIVGGYRTFYGPILGTIVLVIFDEALRSLPGFEDIRPAIYGFILIASILFLPDGIESIVKRPANYIAKLLFNKQ